MTKRQRKVRASLSDPTAIDSALPAQTLWRARQDHTCVRVRKSASQRLLPVAASSRTHADRHQAVAATYAEPARVRELCEVQRSFTLVVTVSADLLAALRSHERVLSTHSGTRSPSPADLHR